MKIYLFAVIACLVGISALFVTAVVHGILPLWFW